MDKLLTLREGIPTFECIEGCSDCCSLAFFTDVERSRIVAAGGLMRDQADDMDCRYLVDHKCSIYQERPLICRLFGASTALPCPHGRGPAKPLTEAEFDARMVAYRRDVGDDCYTNLGGEVLEIQEGKA
jgi:Fe-S-cluster containining protein